MSEGEAAAEGTVPGTDDLRRAVLAVPGVDAVFRLQVRAAEVRVSIGVDPLWAAPAVSRAVYAVLAEALGVAADGDRAGLQADDPGMPGMPGSGRTGTADGAGAPAIDAGAPAITVSVGRIG